MKHTKIKQHVNIAIDIKSNAILDLYMISLLYKIDKAFHWFGKMTQY